MIRKSSFVLSFVDNWWSKHISILSFLLLPWSILFLTIVVMRRWCYRFGLKKSTVFNVPVIIIGNIVVGGTGKTPLVIYLAQLMKQQGYHPGIVSHGYGVKKIIEPIEVLSHNNPAKVGDEPVLITKRADCPMVISVDRVAAVQHLLEIYHCDVVLSDDGMQHYALARDIEIVVVDGARRFGNKLCLPAGPLREPLNRLNKVDWIVCNGKLLSKSSRYFDQSVLMQLSPKNIVSVREPDKHFDIDYFKDFKVHAVAGIGNPKRFFDELREMGLEIIEHPFSDHYRFTRKDIDFGPKSAVIMTEKDAVKCYEFVDDRYFFVPVAASLPEEFDRDFLDKVTKIKMKKGEKR